MNFQPIQEILDNLDVQLASGKIDLETHRRLTAKWQVRLGEPRTSEPAAAPATTLVACPECSAPLENPTTALGSVIRCGFCRATFTLKQAQDQTEQANLDLRQWLNEMVVDTSAGGMVDTASRRFIFAEKLFPALQLDYRRGMEPFEDIHEHPLLSLDLVHAIPGYNPADHPLIRHPEALPGIRALAHRVNSPLVNSFAIAPEDRSRLQDLELGTAHLVYLANAANLLLENSPEAYAAAKENVMAMLKEYDEPSPLAHGPGHGRYVQAMHLRLEGAAQALTVLESIMAPDADFSARVYVENLDAANAQFDQAHRLADEADHDPLRWVPFKTGLERDQKVLQLIRTLLRSYQIAARSRPLVFSSYHRELKAILATVCPNPRDPLELSTAIERLNNLMEARRGRPILHRVDDWSWYQARVDAGRKQSLFGPNEVARAIQGYWHPYWYATLRYSVAKGTFIVSGVEQLGYMLLEAIQGNNPIPVPANSPFCARLTDAIRNTWAGDEIPILPAFGAGEAAERIMLAAARSVPDFRTANVQVQGIVYLPAVVCRYESKAGSRPACFSIVGNPSTVVGRLLPPIDAFLKRYH